MTRVVFFIDHLRADGSQRVLCQLARGLIARGHGLAVVALNDSWDAAIVEQLRRAGARLRIVGKRALAGGYGLVSLLAWLRRERFDAAVTMLFASDVLGRALARAAGVPRVVSSIRARNVNYGLWQLLLVRATMPLADAVVVNGWATREFAVAAEGARPERLVYIPNGVDSEAYARPMDRAALRAELGLPPEAQLIGSVGRLTRQKGLDVLLDALAAPALADVHALLAGAGEEEGRLRAQAERLGLDGRVHFVGYRRDVPRLLGALDLYVHPARFEGMSNALLEAMAAGCPIVATNVDGSSELIGDGAHGWLVPAEQSGALAAAVAAALGDPAEARRRGEAARERARRCFGLDVMVRRWEQVLYAAP
mgnify:CR=1 FL=1